MSTYSQLTVKEQERFWERFNRAINRYGISQQDYKALALEEHRLQRWAEQECNGEIQRDDDAYRGDVIQEIKFYDVEGN